jgi:hypothetical protein
LRVLGGVREQRGARDDREKPYGWIFLCNEPVVVMVDSGELITLGTASPPEGEIAKFERERGLEPDGMTGIDGMEADWLACDADDCVALFSTAGGGYAPREFLKDIDAHGSAIEDIERLDNRLTNEQLRLDLL